MSRFNRVSLTPSLVVAIAVVFAPLLVAQTTTPCFDECHAAAMDRYNEGMPHFMNDAIFKLCLDLC